MIGVADISSVTARKWSLRQLVTDRGRSSSTIELSIIDRPALPAFAAMSRRNVRWVWPGLTGQSAGVNVRFRRYLVVRRTRSQGLNSTEAV
jgi:hypothetical protein